MILTNRPQRVARSKTKTLGLLLLPLALCGLAFPFQRVLATRALAPSVQGFTAAIRGGDWRSAALCYPQEAAPLRQEIETHYGTVRSCVLWRTEGYHLPSSGEHVIYLYDLHCEWHDARMTVRAGVRKGTHPTWEVESVLLSPAP